jgi:hypothetical protein
LSFCRDGFTPADFHKCCDNKGATLAVIQSKDGYLFGGYTPLSWDSKSNYIGHPNMFIFTLSNPHNIPPTKYPKGATNKGILCYETHAITFGGGFDIFVETNSHQNNSSFTYFPGTYLDTTNKGKETFTGALNFTTSDYEVYSVSDLYCKK